MQRLDLLHFTMTGTDGTLVEPDFPVSIGESTSFEHSVR